MNTKYDFLPGGEDKIVYVRPVKAEDLPEELREQAQGMERIYALHDSSGERLALVHDRKLAFVLARQNDLAPVSVH